MKLAQDLKRRNALLPTLAGKITREKAASFANDICKGLQRKKQTLAVVIHLIDVYNRLQVNLLMKLLAEHGVSLVLTRWLAAALKIRGKSKLNNIAVRGKRRALNPVTRHSPDITQDSAIGNMNNLEDNDHVHKITNHALIQEVTKLQPETFSCGLELHKSTDEEIMCVETEAKEESDRGASGPAIGLRRLIYQTNLLAKDNQGTAFCSEGEHESEKAAEFEFLDHEGRRCSAAQPPQSKEESRLCDGIGQDKTFSPTTKLQPQGQEKVTEEVFEGALPRPDPEVWASRPGRDSGRSAPSTDRLAPLNCIMMAIHVLAGVEIYYADAQVATALLRCIETAMYIFAGATFYCHIAQVAGMALFFAIGTALEQLTLELTLHGDVACCDGGEDNSDGDGDKGGRPDGGQLPQGQAGHSGNNASGGCSAGCGGGSGDGNDDNDDDRKKKRAKGNGDKPKKSRKQQTEDRERRATDDSDDNGDKEDGLSLTATEGDGDPVCGSVAASVHPAVDHPLQVQQADLGYLPPAVLSIITFMRAAFQRASRPDKSCNALSQSSQLLPSGWAAPAVFAFGRTPLHAAGLVMLGWVAPDVFVAGRTPRQGRGLVLLSVLSQLRTPRQGGGLVLLSVLSQLRTPRQGGGLVLLSVLSQLRTPRQGGGLVLLSVLSQLRTPRQGGGLVLLSVLDQPGVSEPSSEVMLFDFRLYCFNVGSSLYSFQGNPRTTLGLREVLLLTGAQAVLVLSTEIPSTFLRNRGRVMQISQGVEVQRDGSLAVTPPQSGIFLVDHLHAALSLSAGSPGALLLFLFAAVLQGIVSIALSLSPMLYGFDRSARQRSTAQPPVLFVQLLSVCADELRPASGGQRCPGQQRGLQFHRVMNSSSPAEGASSTSRAGPRITSPLDNLLERLRSDDGPVPGPDVSPPDSRGEDPTDQQCREDDSSDQRPVAANREDHDHDRGPVSCGDEDHRNRPPHLPEADRYPTQCSEDVIRQARTEAVGEDEEADRPEVGQSDDDGHGQASAQSPQPARLFISGRYVLVEPCQDDLYEARTRALEEENSRLRQPFLCPCCWMKIFEILLQPCHHCVCFDCIWWTRPRCPLCWEPVTSYVVIRFQ